MRKNREVFTFTRGEKDSPRMGDILVAQVKFERYPAGNGQDIVYRSVNYGLWAGAKPGQYYWYNFYAGHMPERCMPAGTDIGNLPLPARYYVPSGAASWIDYHAADAEVGGNAPGVWKATAQ